MWLFAGTLAILIFEWVNFVLATSDKCWEINHGLSNGCNVPDFTPYKQTFTLACYQHDICYTCGTLFEKDRSYCDIYFLADMRNSCNGLEGLDHSACHISAFSYYVAVTVAAQSYFLTSNNSQSCHQTWVSTCFR